MTTLQYVYEAVLPTAYTLLPERLGSTRALDVFLLTIGMQESRFQYRRQIHGPARGFWQFEEIGVRGVLEHPRSSRIILDVLETMSMPRTPREIHVALEHSDILAACFARCNVWTSSRPIPEDAAAAWELYLSIWRPGRPHPETWTDMFLTVRSVVGGVESRRA